MTQTQPALDYIPADEFSESDGVDDWPVLGDGATTFFATDSVAASARLVQAIGDIDGVDDLKPDIDIRPDGVTVRLMTYQQAFAGMTRQHVDLARRISAAAERLGLRADPSSVQAVQPIIVGSTDIPRVMPFWKALMGYEQRADSPDEDIVDPRGRGPGVWFEQIQDPASTRPHMHVAVWVPYEQAQARVDAVIAAGGTLIFDEYAPAWWTLADPDGNEADVATTRHRD